MKNFIDKYEWDGRMNQAAGYMGFHLIDFINEKLTLVKKEEEKK
jgi:hypothetical protein